MMKFLLLALLITTPFLGIAQEGLETALGKGDVETMSTWMDRELELCIFNKEDVFEKPGAVRELRQFFNQYSAKGFKSIHKGSSKTAESNYTIGNLSTDKGTFRVHIYYSGTSGKERIQELRIDKND